MSAPTAGPACEFFTDAIDELVDGTLDGERRSALDRHLAACPSCRRLVADLFQIRQAAGGFTARSPRADAWDRIARELTRVMPASRLSPRSAWTPFRIMLATAAALTLAVASTVWLVRPPAAAGTSASPAPASASPGAAVHPSPQDLVKSIDDELRAAELHYERAIAGLELVAKTDQSVLDPVLAATLQKNLGVIDQAIRDSRAAIQSQPASQMAQDSLFEALRRKVALLEDTIALINVMRKGDEAGTARVIQGLNKS